MGTILPAVIPTLGELIDAYLAEHRRQSHGNGQLHQSPQSLPVHGHPSLFVQISAKKRKPPARPGWRSTHHGCGPHASITWIGFDGSTPESTQVFTVSTVFPVHSWISRS